MKYVDYDALYDELLKEYLGTEYYPAVSSPEKYIATEIEATTIDEYLMLLRKGYINVKIRPEVDKHLMELLEDDWFHQWPMVRWIYASRLLQGKGCEKNVNRAIEILDSLAKEGCPGAMFEIGGYYRYGAVLGANPGRAICLWIEASKKGYHEAQDRLSWEYESGAYKKLGEEIQMFLLYEVLMIFLESKGATQENYKEKLNEQEFEVFKQIVNRGKRLEKVVSEKAFMRSSAAGLAWSKDENPYKINF